MGEALLTLICWVRIAVSPSLGGMFVGLALFFLIGGVVGMILAVAVLVCGLLLGVVLAERARRKGLLVDYVHRFGS